MLTPEQQTELGRIRLAAQAGTATLDDMRKAILWLREARRSAAESPSSKPRSAKRSGPTASADQLLDELENL